MRKAVAIAATAAMVGSLPMGAVTAQAADDDITIGVSIWSSTDAVSYTHLRAHETARLISYAVFCLKKFFFNDTATTEIYTDQQSSAASDVYKRQHAYLT